MSANEFNRRTFLRGLNKWCWSCKQRYIIKGNVNVYCLDFYHQYRYDHSRHLAASNPVRGIYFDVLMTASLSFHASSLELGGRFSSHVGFQFKQLGV